MNQSSKNHNEITFLKWWLMKNDHLDEIVFFFKSKRNSDNKRFYPLYEKYDGVRIISLGGLNLKYFDSLSFKFLKFLKYISKQKIQSYKTLHSFDYQERFKVRQIILQNDDPDYSKSEQRKLKNWEEFYTNIGSDLLFICTNNYSKHYFSLIFQNTKIFIIEQGFHEVDFVIRSRASTKFVCGYSSAYIYYGRDKQANHSTWGASILIDEIIPNLTKLDRDINFLIIGQVGRYARIALEKYPNVYLSGRVSSEKNIQLLSNCNIGLYTRNFDHNRSVLKIFTYIGAGLPIVTFDLNDTKIVKLHKIGFSVKNTAEFIDKVLLLKNSPELLNIFRERIIKLRPTYTWQSLAYKLNKIVDMANF